MALSRRIPFLCYILPDDGTVVFRCTAPGVADAAGPFTSLSIVPWSTPASRASLLPLSADEHFPLSHLNRFPNRSADAIPAPQLISTPREDYIRTVSSVISGLRDATPGSKVVISRTLCGRIPDFSAEKLIEIASRIFAAHPSALRYILLSPSSGLWLGATPELLADIDLNERRLSTVALAGTRSASLHGKPWDVKNIVEQDIVARFILDALSSIGCKSLTATSHSVVYGSIEHIATSISASIPALHPSKILDALSPTPALAGFPRDRALDIISHSESHPRRLYGGYLALSSPSRILAFVNIRCMQLDMLGHYCLYGGGGILPDSVPADEWEETEAKISNLLNFLS